MWNAPMDQIQASIEQSEKQRGSDGAKQTKEKTQSFLQQKSNASAGPPTRAKADQTQNHNSDKETEQDGLTLAAQMKRDKYLNLQRQKQQQQNQLKETLKEAEVKDSRTFTDYRLVSASREKTYNVLRFLSAQTIDPKTFTKPVKLHRKERYTNPNYSAKGGNGGANNDLATGTNTNTNAGTNHNANTNASAGTPGGLEDGSKVKDDKLVVVESGSGAGQGGNSSGGGIMSKADTSIIAPFGGGVRNKQQLFKKKTRQIYFADEQQRRLNIEEARPWVLEDFDSKQEWTGTLEGGQKSEYVFFVLMEDGFSVVPVKRWYKFAPKIKYATLSLDEAEEELKKVQKNEPQNLWLMKKRARDMQQAATSAGATGNGNINSPAAGLSALLENASQDSEKMKKNKKGGKRSKRKLVDHMDGTGGDSDEEGGGRKSTRVTGQHGDLDELDYEEAFEDDEEMADDLGDENEDQGRGQKEVANYLERSDNEEEQEQDDKKLGEAGQGIRKLMKKREKADVYDSDREENPYISEESEQSEDEKPPQQQQSDSTAGQTQPSERDNQQQQQQQQLFGTAVGSTGQPTDQKTLASSTSISDNTAMGVNTAGRSLAQQQQQQQQRQQQQQQQQQQPVDPSLLTEQEVANLIRGGDITTKDLITKVKHRLKDNPLNKQRISDIVKRIATQKNGLLVLKQKR
ncbi:Transcription initiation factor IIF subunit alpha [Zancudomyces culisetae]|uniref:Transcription initiation factor IIF subunit alpha n=1 Tax=Zancudomyces culisetae TaxID=1213189 RepID=A0A1R1PSP6_ZANCU|nr:Transcription initiation factor IIF subunit alpha [Zancudomyces culisetae]|eukprot:OMH83964.1 Transcription initiation factor IIF subunit alpha [Zancudomyces culisetae]